MEFLSWKNYLAGILSSETRSSGISPRFPRCADSGNSPRFRSVQILGFRPVFRGVQIFFASGNGPGKISLNYGHPSGDIDSGSVHTFMWKQLRFWAMHNYSPHNSEETSQNSALNPMRATDCAQWISYISSHTHTYLPDTEIM